MPRSKEPQGFQPIEVEVGEQNRPIISEVDFETPDGSPVKPHASADPKPQTAAKHKED